MYNDSHSDASRHQNPVRVLIVDDHPVVRDGYRRLLESTGDITVVAEADTAESGYAQFKSARPDIVIMDLSIPGAGGLEAIRRITQWDAAARVLVFTMHENPVFCHKAMEAGAIGYLTKRCAPSTMVEAVHEVARGRRYQALEVNETGIDPALPSLDTLTLREFEVFDLLAQGHSVQNTARVLNISPNTVGVHQTRIMNKLGISNAAQLVRVAIAHGVVKV